MSHVSDYYTRSAEKSLQERRADLAAVLSTPAGRRVYIGLRNGSGVFDNAPADEPARTEWLGRRNFGMTILDAFHDADPEACRLAEREAEHAAAVEAAALEEAKRRDREEGAIFIPFGKMTQEKP